MKILILSDIHANWYALEATLDKETYDALVFLGDVVDFGPSPRNCIKFLIKSSKTHFWGVRGDHDHAMAYGINSKCPGELNTVSDATREWGEGFLSSEEVGFLRRLPIKNDFSIDSMNFELAHGLDTDPKEFFKCQARGIESKEIYHNDEIEGEGKSEINFILVGHSHKPFIKSVGNTTILNPGSVGQPRDYNPRASYDVIENGTAYIRRVPYDIEKTVNDLERSALPSSLQKNYLQYSMQEVLLINKLNKTIINIRYCAIFNLIFCIKPHTKPTLYNLIYYLLTMRNRIIGLYIVLIRNFNYYHLSYK